MGRYFIVLLILCCGCSGYKRDKGFVLMPPAATGIDFANRLTLTEAFNCYTYRNFYNGAGVAIGDINNDGLPDIYFSGNQVNNKLYLNKGNFQFEDITHRPV